MNADRFLRTFGRAFSEVRPTGFDGNWTTGVYAVLDRVAKEEGYLACHKNSTGELWRMDFAFCKKTDNIKTNWYPPVAVIEHENSTKFEDTRYDFCKLCLYAIPLRIMIGYGANQETARQSGQNLVDFYAEYDHTQMPSGETLIMMGWKQTPAFPFHYHLWLLKDEDVPRRLYNVATDEIDVRLSEWA